MQTNNVRRIRKGGAALAMAAALTFAGIGTVGAGSAYAGTKDVSANIDWWAPTYTCDTLTIVGDNTGDPGAVAVKDAGNCVPSGGAPTPPMPNFIGNNVSLVQRSGGTVFHCYSGYLGATWVDLPTFVESIDCIPAS